MVIQDNWGSLFQNFLNCLEFHPRGIFESLNTNLEFGIIFWKFSTLGHLWLKITFVRWEDVRTSLLEWPVCHSIGEGRDNLSCHKQNSEWPVSHVELLTWHNLLLPPSCRDRMGFENFQPWWAYGWKFFQNNIRFVLSEQKTPGTRFWTK